MLITADAIATSQDVPEWAIASVAQIHAAIGDPDFPCLFAKRASELKLESYCLLDSLDSHDAREHVRCAVVAYLDALDRESQASPALRPLLVVVKPVHPPLTVDAYHAQAWSLLQHLHDRDPSTWPADMPVDPERGDWSFCFAGRQLFSNVSCPAHCVRTSRNLGDALVFVMQPRTNFDVVAGDTEKGRRVRARIRERVHRYEGSVPDDLGVFGQPENREWKQYTVREGDAPYPATCPLRLRADRRST